MGIFGSFRKKSGKSLEMKDGNRSDRWQIGDRIGNRYEVYKILGGEGKSGMGIVYVCYDHKHNAPLALKTFQEKYLHSRESQKFFEREALVWIELKIHPYIVFAHWVDKLEGRLFIVLEYVAPDRKGRNTLTHYLGRYQDAITCYDKALEIDPGSAIAWINRGAVLYYLNRFDEALRCVEEAIKINPDYTDAHQLKQLILQKLRR